MTFKKAIGKVHLWLGFTSGLLVLFLGLTGCILAYQREIEDLTQPYRFVTYQPDAKLLPPSQLKAIADKQLPGKHAHSVSYSYGKASVVMYFQLEPEYYHLVYLNPYTGHVLQVKNMDQDFFRFMIMGHYYLWLPPTVGQPILASATLIFVLLMITGMVLWWPKNKAARKQRFSIKWNANWRRVNYDAHNVLGFYMTWVALFIAITGLVMGFQWFAKSVYWVSSGGKEMTQFYEPQSAASPTKTVANVPVIDQVWAKILPQVDLATGSLEVHMPANARATIETAYNPDPSTYWKTDYQYFDQNTLKAIPVTHVFGRFKETSVADKIMRMNYDVHVGAIGGLAGKTIAFFASLLAASLPVTGFLIWWGRNKKNKKARQPQRVLVN